MFPPNQLLTEQLNTQQWSEKIRTGSGSDQPRIHRKKVGVETA